MANNFVPISFGGSLPEYYYNGNGGAGGGAEVVIGVDPILWKLEVDFADGNKLKFYYSTDNGNTYTLKMELNPT